MTLLQLLFLVSCISQGTRYGAQLKHLIESVCHRLKLDAAWSKLASVNISVMHVFLSPTRGLISQNLRKL